MVDHTADEVRAIASASEEQSAASAAINKSLKDVNFIAKSTADSMEVAAREMALLRTQAQDMAKLVGRTEAGVGVGAQLQPHVITGSINIFFESVERIEPLPPYGSELRMDAPT